MDPISQFAQVQHDQPEMIFILTSMKLCNIHSSFLQANSLLKVFEKKYQHDTDKSGRPITGYKHIFNAIIKAIVILLRQKT